jgi:hypothetical protein
MHIGFAADPSIVAPIPSILGDDSSKLEGEDVGGGRGACSPSGMEVGSASYHQTMDFLLLEESEDDAEAHSSALLWSVGFRATVLCPDVGTSDVIPSPLHLGEYLLSVFALFDYFML